MAAWPTSTAAARFRAAHRGEAFVRVHINLLAVRGTRSIRSSAMSHTVLLGQCREFLRAHGIHRWSAPTPPGSAQIVAAAQGEPTLAALASELAGEIYGLDVLARHIEDQSNNTTRFLLMSREPGLRRRGEHG
jgi:prephenate dehydratase